MLGIGDQVQDTAPQASFTFDFSEETSQDELTVTHDGGDKIAPQRITIQTQSEDWTTSADGTATTSKDWETASGSSNDVGAGAAVTMIDADQNLDGDTVRVTWESAGGGDSATLGKFSGPNA